MARFMPVCPARIYKELHTVDPMLVHANLFLAHDVVEDADNYKFFRDNNIIHSSVMDNSLIELGGAVDVNMVKEAVGLTRSNVYVLPDVQSDGKASLDATKAAYQSWIDTIPNASPMAVVQGKDKADFLACLTGLLSLPKQIQWIGIPRNTVETNIFTSRKDAIDLVRLVHPYARIHLLGFSNNVIDDLLSAIYSPAVSSIDSAVPLRLGSAKVDMRTFTDPGPRGDWWTTAQWDPQIAVNVSWLQNILR